MGSARATLIDDRGAAAVSADFFRSRPFLLAERATHTLLVEGDGATVALPMLVRAIPASARMDAVSPYGYPGGRISGRAPGPAPAEVDWSGTGLVSVFVRERLGATPSLDAASGRSLVQVHDPTRPRVIRGRYAAQIRQNARRGWQVDAVAGPAVATADVDAFAVLYEQTMRRNHAAARYFFEPDYFRAILGFERSWLLSARMTGVPVGAAAIAALSDGTLHYYLGGTADTALAESPFKNVVAAMLDLADELGVPLNLGGGIAAGDRLEAFKRGFANAELPFRTHEIVCDRREYEHLGAGGAPEGFFPAYRAQRPV